jgi:hypothetical protein
MVATMVHMRGVVAEEMVQIDCLQFTVERRWQFKAALSSVKLLKSYGL